MRWSGDPNRMTQVFRLRYALSLRCAECSRRSGKSRGHSSSQREETMSWARRRLASSSCSEIGFHTPALKG